MLQPPLNKTRGSSPRHAILSLIQQLELHRGQSMREGDEYRPGAHSLGLGDQGLHEGHAETR
jgi:hypothetical protein